MSDRALADQPTAKPTEKWKAGVGTGGGVLVLLWAARGLGLDVPAEVGEALILGLGGLAAWLKRNRQPILDAVDRVRDAGAHHDLDGDGLPG